MNENLLFSKLVLITCSSFNQMLSVTLVVVKCVLYRVLVLLFFVLPLDGAKRTTYLVKALRAPSFAETPQSMVEDNVGRLLTFTANKKETRISQCT